MKMTVSQASEIILSHRFDPLVVYVPLSDALGYVLAEPVYADRDFPPFDRVMMDGIALSYETFSRGSRTFTIAGVQPAGAPASTLSQHDACLEVMTGAMLPKGTDTVIPYEQIDIAAGQAKVLVDNVAPRQHIHRRGADVKRGSRLLKEGMHLSPAEIALLASIGGMAVPVRLWPRVAIVTTGDELVDVNAIPEPHQIRRSNAYALEAALRQCGVQSTLHHVVDDEDTLRGKLQQLMHRHDVIILSGGVSRGKFDYVPAVLEQLGVTRHFHGVAQRPGKPFWFGRHEENNTTVFALPGNPVSTFLCFYKYVRPWMMQSTGLAAETPTAILAEAYTFEPAVTCFLQVRLVIAKGGLQAHPVAGQGSGDFANLAQVHGWLELPADRAHFKPGEVFPFIPFRPFL